MISPCNGVCVLDAASGWCRGCLRSIEEIGGWSALAESERQAIMADAARRERACLGRSGDGADGQD